MTAQDAQPHSPASPGLGKSNEREVPVVCPRCGYDLSGTIGSWRTSCPLEGACSECGLGIRWAELLGGAIIPPWWYIEAVPGRVIRRWLLTWVRHLVPGRLWGRVDLRMELRAWRLATFAALGIAVSHAGVAAVEIGFELHHLQRYMAMWSGRSPRPMPTIRSWVQWDAIAWPYALMAGESTPDVLALLLFPVLAGLLMPALCFLFSDTLRLERVRLLHLIRIGALWLPTSFVAGAIGVTMWGLQGKLSTSPVANVLSIAMLPAVAVLWIVWPLAFWWRAMGRYLRMSRAWLAAIVLGVSSIVVSFALTLLYAMMVMAWQTP